MGPEDFLKLTEGFSAMTDDDGEFDMLFEEKGILIKQFGEVEWLMLIED